MDLAGCAWLGFAYTPSPMGGCFAGGFWHRKRVPCMRSAVVFAFPCSVGCVCCGPAGYWCDFCRQGFLFWPLLSVLTCGSGGLVPGSSCVSGSAGVGVLGVQARQRGGTAAAAVAGAAQALSPWCWGCLPGLCWYPVCPRRGCRSKPAGRGTRALSDLPVMPVCTFRLCLPSSLRCLRRDPALWCPGWGLCQPIPSDFYCRIPSQWNNPPTDHEDQDVFR